MKKLICFTAILGLFACGQSPTGLNPKNQIASNVSVFDPADVRNFVTNQRLTREQVQDSLTAMKISFKASYIGYEVKKQLAGTSGDEVFANCQQMIPAAESFSAFEYYDIVHKCLAQFKDSHISIGRAISPAYVSTAISRTILIGEKVFISRTRNNVVKKFEEMQNVPAGTLAAFIKPGTEIVSIDGINAKEALKQMHPYISASSDLAREQDAADRFFTRIFDYPKNKTVTLKLKAADASETDVTLPWLFIVKNSSLESRVMLSEAGILSSDDLNSDKNFVNTSGFEMDAPLFKDMAAQKNYTDDEDSTLLVTGIVNRDGKNICYMQLNSFSLEEKEDFGFKVYTKIDNINQPVNFLNEVKTFLGTCEAYSSPLILDMRENGGGNGNLADMFFRLFERADTPLNFTARAYQLQNGNFSVLSDTFQDLNLNKDSFPLARSLIFKAARDAGTRQQKITDWVLVRPKNSEAVFSGPMNVIISQNCVSACENTSNRFKVTGRAKIIGTHSAGTGFGFNSNENKTTFRDPYNMFEVDILNSAFQTGVVPENNEIILDDKTRGRTVLLSEISFLENNPVQPHEIINYTVNDLSGEFTDFAASVLKSFDPAK